jgi:hypothetical protein
VGSADQFDEMPRHTRRGTRFAWSRKERQLIAAVDTGERRGRRKARGRRQNFHRQDRAKPAEAAPIELVKGYPVPAASADRRWIMAAPT